MLTVLLAIGAGFAGCGSLTDDLKLCGEIPAGGCPVGRGGSCEDKACAALYDCLDGSWVTTTTCEREDAGGAGGGDAGSDAPCGVAIDRTGEAAGCVPDLQTPDCPAAAAESCAACQTDCVDFFLCTNDGWITVAYCDDRGQIVVTP